MKHIVMTAVIAGCVGLVAGPASAQYRAPLKPVTTLTNKPAVGGAKLAPSVNPGISANIRSNVGGGRLIANDGAGIVAGGAGNFRAR